MNDLTLHNLSTSAIALSLAVLVPPSSAEPFSLISASEMLTAVSAKQFNGYVRSKRTDGSFRPETFAFGNGGQLPTSFISDPDLDNVGFDSIAHMLAGPLANQGYVPSHDPNNTELLIMVFWGSAAGGNFSKIGGSQDAINFSNASLMGFDYEAHLFEEISQGGFRAVILREAHSDVLDAVEVSRYYVILRAFDFKAAWKQRRLSLLWETRFSLSARRHDFGEDLSRMARSASFYFGKDSYGMVKVPLIPEGNVEIGHVKILDDQDPPDTGNMESQNIPPNITGDWLGNTPGNAPVIIRIGQPGSSTFKNREQGATLVAHVLMNLDAVTITVPGWDVVFRGAIKGKQIIGTLSEYGRTSSLTLSKSPKPIQEPYDDSDVFLRELPPALPKALLK
jgi:hypothetical protein